MDIYIRPLKKEDALTSFRWRNNPDIWKFTGSKPDKIITPEIELKWIQKVLKEEDSKRFAICLKENNKYIGNIQLTNIRNQTAEFHIFIGEQEFWGKGIGTKATKLILKYGFEKLNLKQIYLYVSPKNIAAIKSYEKCGFIFQQKIDDEKMLFVLNNENSNDSNE